ncbi:MAG: hypothetical protein AB1705_10715 [Verrucomicrobiota bacterium]
MKDETSGWQEEGLGVGIAAGDISIGKAAGVGNMDAVDAEP